MPRPTADEVVTQGHVRNFVQFGGPRPNNVPAYAGQDAQYMSVESVSIGDDGSREPIWVPDPSRPKGYRMVGRKVSPPELSSANLILLEKHGAIPRQLQKVPCTLNIYQPVGNCKDLSDFLSGWTDYVLIYSYGEVSGAKDLGSRNAWDADDALADTIPLSLFDIYPIGALSFGDNAQAIVTLEAIDVTYCSSEQCGNCGPMDDGTNRIYAVTESSGSTPGTAPRVIYSVDGGDNWTNSAIDGIGDIEDPISIDCVGPYLVVVTRTAGGATTGGYYYSTINSDTGAPGSWTKVTSGFVASFQPYDVYVLSPREIFISADGGYIYKSTDIASGVTTVQSGDTTTTALRRIHGDGGETIVAVGGSGVVLISSNRGGTWRSSSAVPVVATLQAVNVLDEKRIWVGSASGTLWYTLTGGASWSQKGFSGSGAGQIRDIIFATDEVGFMSHDTATPTARVFATWDGGNTWTNSPPRVLNMPTYNRANRIAVPERAHASIAANTVMVAGLAGNGTDGILLQGLASRL